MNDDISCVADVLAGNAVLPALDSRAPLTAAAEAAATLVLEAVWLLLADCNVDGGASMKMPVEFLVDNIRL